MTRISAFAARLFAGLAAVIIGTVSAKVLQFGLINFFDDARLFDVLSLAAIGIVVSLIYFLARRVSKLGWIIGRNG